MNHGIVTISSLGLGGLYQQDKSTNAMHTCLITVLCLGVTFDLESRVIMKTKLKSSNCVLLFHFNLFYCECPWWWEENNMKKLMMRIQPDILILCSLWDRTWPIRSMSKINVYWQSSSYISQWMDYSKYSLYSLYCVKYKMEHDLYWECWVRSI